MYCPYVLRSGTVTTSLHPKCSNGGCPSRETKPVRVDIVGFRPLCDPCENALAALGLVERRVPWIRHDPPSGAVSHFGCARASVAIRPGPLPGPSPIALGSKAGISSSRIDAVRAAVITLATRRRRMLDV